MLFPTEELLPVVHCLGLKPPERFPFHVGNSAGVVPVQVMFRHNVDEISWVYLLTFLGDNLTVNSTTLIMI